MHEAAIAQNLIEQVDRYMLDHKIQSKVKKIFLRIGKFSTVVPQSLSFCFEVLSADTSLRGVSLEIEEIPIRCKCKNCGEIFDIDEPDFICVKCAHVDLEIMRGRELEIDSLEVENE